VNPASFHDEWLPVDSRISPPASMTWLRISIRRLPQPLAEARDSLLHPLPSTRTWETLPLLLAVRPNDTGPLWMGALNETNKTPGAAYMVRTFKAICSAYAALADAGPANRRRRFSRHDADFVKQFTNRAVSTEDFKSLVEKHMKPGMDVDGNHAWTGSSTTGLRHGHPSYRLEYSLTPGKNGKQSLAGKLRKVAFTGIQDGVPSSPSSPIRRCTSAPRQSTAIPRSTSR